MQALIILDLFTQWLQGYAVDSKSARDTLMSFKTFLGPKVKAQHVYTDNAKEFTKALRELETSHDTSTPHWSETMVEQREQSAEL